MYLVDLGNLESKLIEAKFIFVWKWILIRNHQARGRGEKAKVMIIQFESMTNLQSIYLRKMYTHSQSLSLFSFKMKYKRASALSSLIGEIEVNVLLFE